MATPFHHMTRFGIVCLALSGSLAWAQTPTPVAPATPADTAANPTSTPGNPATPGTMGGTGVNGMRDGSTSGTPSGIAPSSSNMTDAERMRADRLAAERMDADGTRASERRVARADRN